MSSVARSQETIAEPLLTGFLAPDQVTQLCRQSPVGKLLPDALYVHVTALGQLDPALQQRDRQARALGDRIDRDLTTATLVKFSLSQPTVSYLFYPDFDTDPHPALHASVLVRLDTQQCDRRQYSTSDNPPILHRKETFVAPDYPLYPTFAALTQQEVACGLLDNPRTIGTRNGWQQRLQACKVAIAGHRVIREVLEATLPTTALPTTTVARHKAAIARTDLSRPVKLALEAGLFEADTTFFDYGCGHGGDLQRMTAQGYVTSGWDPYYRPDTPRTAADVVNLGYVINVIEDPQERREALLKAWDLAGQVLLVAAQVLLDDRDRGWVAFGDGVITSRNTFQKYYEQQELKAYIDGVLGVDALPAGLGVYFVFRDPARAEAFRASRFRSRASTPRIEATVKRFEDYQTLLAPLMAFFTERGRLPLAGELPEEEEIKTHLGSLRRAFQVVLQVTDVREWEAIAQRRQQELKMYLALSHFSRLPRFKDLAPLVQGDVRSLFGSFRNACEEADDMLFSLGELTAIAARCRGSAIGKQLPRSLLVHISALDALDPLLRLYEGCASRTIGRMEEVTLIKFHFTKPKISYLFYPDFDCDPHPAPRTVMQIDLRDLQVRYQDYHPEDAPPLHEKEQVVLPDYPLYEKFARLSRQERDWGLLDDLAAIRDRAGWERCLAEHCAALQGYRLVRRKDADPYKLRLLRAEVRRRQEQRREAEE